MAALDLIVRDRVAAADDVVACRLGPPGTVLPQGDQRARGARLVLDL
jgi:hypothetical protein